MKFALNVIVTVIGIVASVLFDLAVAMILVEGYQDIETIVMLISAVLAVTAVDINMFKKFVRD